MDSLNARCKIYYLCSCLCAAIILFSITLFWQLNYLNKRNCLTCKGKSGGITAKNITQKIIRFVTFGPLKI